MRPFGRSLDEEDHLGAVLCDHHLADWNVAFHLTGEGNCAYNRRVLSIQVNTKYTYIYIYLHIIHVLLTVDELLHHLELKSSKSWDRLPMNWCRIVSINSAEFLGVWLATWNPRILES